MLTAVGIESRTCIPQPLHLSTRVPSFSNAQVLKNGINILVWAEFSVCCGMLRRAAACCGMLQPLVPGCYTCFIQCVVLRPTTATNLPLWVKIVACISLR